MANKLICKVAKNFNFLVFPLLFLLVCWKNCIISLITLEANLRTLTSEKFFSGSHFHEFLVTKNTALFTESIKKLENIFGSYLTTFEVSWADEENAKIVLSQILIHQINLSFS
jgi:hypothetical protein